MDVKTFNYIEPRWMKKVTKFTKYYLGHPSERDSGDNLEVVWAEFLTIKFGIFV